MRQETCHIDGIGRSKIHHLIQILIHKRTLYQSLTIIERPIDFKGCNIPAQCRKLLFLYFAYLAFGIKHIHMYARIARRSNQDIDFLISFPLDKITEQTRHETRPHIFECQRGTVKKFETVYRVMHPYQRNIEAKGIVNDIFKHIGLYVLSEKCFGYNKRNFPKRHFSHIMEKGGRKSFYFFGHIQPFIRGQPFYHSLFERGGRCLLIGTVILHDYLSYYFGVLFPEKRIPEELAATDTKIDFFPGTAS